jgi:hypothetical protein
MFTLYFVNAIFPYKLSVFHAFFSLEISVIIYLYSTVTLIPPSHAQSCSPLSICAVITRKDFIEENSVSILPSAIPPPPSDSKYIFMQVSDPYTSTLWRQVPKVIVWPRKMENIRRGPVPSGTLSLSSQRGLCRTSWLLDYRVQECRSTSPPLLNGMYCVRVSLRTVKIFPAATL